MKRLHYIQNLRTVVLKVGTKIVSDERNISLIAEGIAFLMKKGINAVLVSSGAIGMALKKLKISEEKLSKLSLPEKQALASVGQVELMKMYEAEMKKYSLTPSQILLTHSILSNRKSYLNARNTFESIFKMGFVPVVNENDTVATDEITFGDNDVLAAMVAILTGADLLVLFTDTEGFYLNYEDPKRRKLIELVEEITPELLMEAKKEKGGVSRGGMLSKLRSADMAVKSGIPVVISSFEKGSLEKIIEGENVGTFFVPSERSISSRKKWIAFHLKPKGKIIVDDGALVAIKEKGKSLLPKGIVDVVGDFKMGDSVEIVSRCGDVVAVGLSNYSARDVKKIKGLHTSQLNSVLSNAPYKVVIHRDNMVVF